MTDILEGKVVFQPEDKNYVPPTAIPAEYEFAEIADKKIKEGFEWGKECAQLVLTRDGREVVELMLDQIIKDNTSQQDPQNIKHLHALNLVDSLTRGVRTFQQDEMRTIEKYPWIYKLAVARAYLKNGSVAHRNREFVLKSKNVDRYGKGFFDGWEKVSELDDSVKNGQNIPWYLDFKDPFESKIVQVRKQ